MASTTAAGNVEENSASLNAVVSPNSRSQFERAYCAVSRESFQSVA